MINFSGNLDWWCGAGRTLPVGPNQAGAVPGVSPAELPTAVSVRRDESGGSLPAAAPGPEIPADLVNHPQYEVLEFLGAGGMGMVYRARHRHMERGVVLKVIHPALLGQPGMAERFRREVQAAARLSHPNVVAAHDAGRVGGTHFLVMEFVDGVDLHRVVAAAGRLPVAQACDYIRQAALGLQHAFERGMAHRDLKPHNLMVTRDGRVKVLDFGLARFVGDTTLLAGSEAPPAAADAGRATPVPPDGLTSEHTGLGTLDYAAPEESADARRADIRADIYSLGCTLYHLLAGTVPFPGGSRLDKVRRHTEEDPEPLTALRPDLSPRLWAVVRRMMAKDPADRFQTPAAVARALAPFAVAVARHVLVVEDHAAARTLVARVLEEAGCRVSVAADGHEALERLAEGPTPDLILLDLVMPVMSGWDFLQLRQRDPRLATVPVVIVSAADFAPAADGAADLATPFDADALTAKVLSLLGLR